MQINLQKRLVGIRAFQEEQLFLGHIQRGGSPCPFDRLLASQMGEKGCRFIDARHWWTMYFNS